MQTILLANAIAQAEALMVGRSEADVRAELTAKGVPEAEIATLAPQRTFPGDRPTAFILLDRGSAPPGSAPYWRSMSTRPSSRACSGRSTASTSGAWSSARSLANARCSSELEEPDRQAPTTPRRRP